MHTLMAALANACKGADQVEFAGFYTMPEDNAKNDWALIHTINTDVLSVTKIHFMYVIYHVHFIHRYLM
jgi:hypothetical protein